MQGKKRTTTAYKAVRRIKTIPLSECTRDYLAECVALGKQPRTVEHYDRSLRLMLECLPSGTPWNDSTAIRGAVAELRRRPYRPTSVSMFLRSWKTFLRFCYSEELIEEDLARHIKPPRTEPRREHLLSIDDLRSLLDATRSGRNARRDEAIILVLFDCGLRAGELSALRVSNVDFGNRSLTVPSGKTGGRTVPIGRACAKALRRHLHEHLEAHDPDAPLFPSSQTSQALTRFALRDMLTRLSARSGIVVHPHQFRHSFAVNYLKNGGDTFSLQRILGHSSLTMTRWYAELSNSDVALRHAIASPADRLGKGR